MKKAVSFFYEFRLNTSARYSEEELIALLRQRSENAFRYLYDHYSAALSGVISSIINDKETANDVLQEAFVNIWKNFETYDSSKGRLFTWMMNIARNASIDKTRSKGYKASQKNQPLEDNVIRIADNAVTNPSLPDQGLKKILSNLKEEYRVLIDLSFFQGFTHEEIAKALGIPLGTVKTRIRTALIQLRTMIK